jgi:hypothetical protein
MGRVLQVSVLTAGALLGTAAAADRIPTIPVGTDYSAASSELNKAGYKPAKQASNRTACQNQSSLCEAFPELRDCSGPGETAVCLFEWTSGDGRSAAFVEARGAGPRSMKVTRAYEIPISRSPYPLGTSGL